MKSAEESIAQNIAHVIFMVGLLIIEPHIVKTLWRWYLVPAGMPAITWATAFGVNLVVAVLVYRWPGERSEAEKQSAIVGAWAMALSAFVVGWFVHVVMS